MGFFGGLIIGILIGVGLIVVFARHERSRTKHRSDLAKTIAAFARMTVEDSRKILTTKWYPPWLTWLNVQLKKIWPYVNEAASELIRSNVEPVLEQYRPIVFSALKFSKFTLGTVAPQFTGISIVEEESGTDRVIMEIEMKWDGNPNIVLGIKTRVGVSLPIQDKNQHYLQLCTSKMNTVNYSQVKNIGFTGVFRLIFTPLVGEFPGFGAVCFSLREKKDLDFTLKVIGGDISTIPGISDALEETIRDAIEDSITWPVRKIIPIIPGDYSDLELKPVGTLEVKLVQAKDLSNKDLVGKSDPFAVLFVRPLRDRTQTSKTINNQLNPVWNEHFEFIVEDISTQHLTIRIFDDEGLQPSELIGCAQVPLKDLEPGKVKDVWLKLVKDLEVQRDNKYRGEVQVELLYCPYGVENIFKNPFEPGYSLTTFEKALKSGADEEEANGLRKSGSRRKSNVIVRGVLSVTVISAEDLPSMDIMGKADPYVVLRLKKTEKKLKTRVVSESLNPFWNQTFDFVVEDALHDMLILEVRDHDTFGKNKIGRVIMTLTRVLLEGEVQETFPIDGSETGKLNLHLKWTPQHKYRDS